MKIKLFMTIFLLAVLAAAGPVCGSTEQFTVEQILSAPFPSSLTASPTGQKIAWAFNNQGIQNIWMAEGPDFQARQMTHFKKDDGRPLRISGFLHDGLR